MRVNRFSGMDDPDMPSLCVNPLSPMAKMISGCGLHYTYESKGVFVEPGWPSTSTDDDADVDDSVPILLILASWLCSGFRKISCVL